MSGLILPRVSERTLIVQVPALWTTGDLNTVSARQK